MFIDAADLLKDPDKIEEIEKASARLVTQAIYELREPAATAFRRERDLPQDIAEDFTREALETVVETDKGNCITTTVFVKYEYKEKPRRLHEITVAALPSGVLQEAYNPSPTDTIWRAGRNAPTLDERFRVRLVFASLKRKARWRIQTIRPDSPSTPGSFPWDE